MFSWLAFLKDSRFRFLIAAAVLAALFTLFPVRVDAPVDQSPQSAQAAPQEQAGVAAGADLSERTDAHTYLHRRITYAPCGHSVQRREPLPASLRGLTRSAFEAALPGVVPGAVVTGFSSAEADIAVRLDIPCPLHWVLLPGEDNMIAVMQNRNGESLETVRGTDVPVSRAGEDIRRPGGIVFDDVQALEGYLESLSS